MSSLDPSTVLATHNDSPKSNNPPQPPSHDPVPPPLPTESVSHDDNALTDNDISDLAPRIQEARDNLKDTVGYLGDENMTADLEWMRCGKDTLLVSSADRTAYNAAKADPANRGRKIAFPPPVPLTLLARISYQDCWLAPCGMWKGPKSVPKSFADIKLSCTFETVEDPILSADFTRAMENIQSILDSGRTLGTKDYRGPLCLDEYGGTKIKLKHKVFDDIRLTNAARQVETGMYGHIDFLFVTLTIVNRASVFLYYRGMACHLR
jgi:hypothetical protein